MAQYPASASIAKNPNGAQAQVAVDSAGNLKVAVVSASEATKSTLNITAATVVKATPGAILSVSIVVAGAAGTLNDCATTGTAAAANEIAALPAAVGTINFGAGGWPCATGIVVVPGAGQTISIAWI